MPTPKQWFMLDLELEMQINLKVAAALKGVSMRQYCVAAIENQMASEESTLKSKDESRSPLTLTKLRDEIFGGVPVEGDSADLIRESREERSDRL